MELLEVISRHVAIDTQAVKIRITHDGREQRLVADIPLLSVGQRIGKLGFIMRREMWRNFDFWLFGSAVFLSIFGIIMIRSAIAGNEILAQSVSRQAIFVVARGSFDDPIFCN